MVCPACGKELQGESPFCGYCGTSLDKKVPDNEASSDPIDASDSAVSAAQSAVNPRRAIRPFAFVLSFVLFLGMLTGAWSAYFVVRNGWEGVPYVDKLSFLPFVKLKEEKTETYLIVKEEPKEENDKEKDSSNPSDGGDAVESVSSTIADSNNQE